MSKLQSCGFFIYRDKPNLSFLLMKHSSRWDFAKGHVDDGETELECALRELSEETGIQRAMIEIDDRFRYDQVYMVQQPKYGGQPRQKTLTLFLAKLLQPNFELVISEHLGYQWIDWQPPHDIQEKAINPTIAAVDAHWKS